MYKCKFSKEELAQTQLFKKFLLIYKAAVRKYHLQECSLDSLRESAFILDIDLGIQRDILKYTDMKSSIVRWLYFRDNNYFIDADATVVENRNKNSGDFEGMYLTIRHNGKQINHQIISLKEDFINIEDYYTIFGMLQHEGYKAPIENRKVPEILGSIMLKSVILSIYAEEEE